MDILNINAYKKTLIPLCIDLMLFIESKGLELKPYPRLIISKDTKYINDPFGKTAWYDPENQEVTLIVSGRHPKDILRSFSHELIHHNQNIKGEFNTSDLSSLADPKYSQNNEHLRNMEAQAYLYGSGLLFREWEDNYKSKNNL